MDRAVIHAPVALDVSVEGRVQGKPKLSPTSAWYVHLADLFDVSDV